MILDGVDDPEAYFSGDWTQDLIDADAVVHTFASSCHDAGPKACLFYRETPAAIVSALDLVIEDIKCSPIPVVDPKVTNAPQLATYADLKRFLLHSLYRPLDFFPILDEILVALEQGDGTPLLSAAAAVGQISLTTGCSSNFTWLSPGSNVAIQYVDEYRKDNWTLEGYQKVSAEIMNVSKCVGDAWTYTAITCQSVDVQPPESVSYQGLLPPSAKLEVPILLLSTTLDPVCPLRNAYKMSSNFPGSVVVTINASGHTSFAAPSECIRTEVASYFGGIVPKDGVMCEPDLQPFETT